MKFLIFNLSVIAALTYLILGPGEIPDLAKMAKNSGAASLKPVSNLVATSSSTISEITKNPIINNSIKGIRDKTRPAGDGTAVHSKPDPRSRVSVSKNRGIQSIKPVPPMPPATTIAERPETIAPKPTRSKPKLSKMKMETATPEQKVEPKSKFMSRENRRKELLKLARSAETFFINRLSR